VLLQILWRQQHHREAIALARQALAGLGTDDKKLAAKIETWLVKPS
jgi:hypothetical protein